MRVIIADDVPRVRETYAMDLIRIGVDVVAEAATPGQLHAQMRLHRPDAVLLDISFGGYRGGPQDDEGIRAAQKLRADYPALGIVMFSVHMSPAYLQRITAIGDGTHIGYLGKDRVCDPRTIADALERTARGERDDPPSRWRGPASVVPQWSPLVVSGTIPDGRLDRPGARGAAMEPARGERNDVLCAVSVMTGCSRRNGARSW